MYLQEIDGPSYSYVPTSIGVINSSQLSAQTGAIDDVHRAILAVTEPTQREEGKRIVEGIAKLKHEIQHDKQLTSVLSEQIS